jgi:hypothetical protein
LVTSIDVYVIAVDAWHKIAYDADTIEVSGMRGEYMCPKVWPPHVAQYWLIRSIERGSRGRYSLPRH